LSRISYRDYLLDLVKVDPSVIPLYQSRTHGEWGVGIDAVSALDVWPFGLPGFQGLQLDPGSAPHMGYTPSGYADGGSDTFHFPDGNASIARLLVRNLIPQAVPGGTVEDVVTARIEYSRLDRPDDAIRMRLGSLTVSVASSGSAAVEIVYSRMDRLHMVRAKHCVLACWNMMIPYICPQLPQKQKEARLPGQGAARLHERGACQLAGVCLAGGRQSPLPGKLPFECKAEPRRQHRRLSSAALTRRANLGPNGADAVPARAVGA
jgi:spermidine dehydrogenase